METFFVSTIFIFTFSRVKIFTSFSIFLLFKKSEIEQNDR